MNLLCHLPANFQGKVISRDLVTKQIILIYWDEGFEKWSITSKIKFRLCHALGDKLTESWTLQVLKQHWKVNLTERTLVSPPDYSRKTNAISPWSHTQQSLNPNERQIYQFKKQTICEYVLQQRSSCWWKDPLQFPFSETAVTEPQKPKIWLIFWNLISSEIKPNS